MARQTHAKMEDATYKSLASWLCPWHFIEWLVVHFLPFWEDNSTLKILLLKQIVQLFLEHKIWYIFMPAIMSLAQKPQIRMGPNPEINWDCWCPVRLQN